MSLAVAGISCLPASGKMVEKALVLREVHMTFRTPVGPLPVLRAFSLEVERGEVVGLVGPSGCGKTTVLRIAAGLLRPQCGEVRVFGKGPRGQASYMPQGDSLLSWRTALGNVLAALEVDGPVTPEMHRHTLALFAQFGLSGFERSFPHELSGGMRRRVALLRAFVARRELLLLDEPFASLDAITRVELQNWLMEIFCAFPRTTVVVTHDVEEALLLCDRILVLSPRPAQIIRQIQPTAARPRARDWPELQALRLQVLSTLTRGKPYDQIG